MVTYSILGSGRWDWTGGKVTRLHHGKTRQAEQACGGWVGDRGMFSKHPICHQNCALHKCSPSLNCVTFCGIEKT